MTESGEVINELVSDRIRKIYADYMMVIRYMLSEGIEEPTDHQNEWALMVANGEQHLARAIALLVRTSEYAYKQRYLEGLPMLNDFDSPPGGEHHGFGSIERFHFLRLFVKEYRNTQKNNQPLETNGLPSVLYMDPAQYNSQDDA